MVYRGLLALLLTIACQSSSGSGADFPLYEFTFDRIMLAEIGCDSLLTPPDDLDAEVFYRFGAYDWNGRSVTSVYWPDSLYAAKLKVGEWHDLVRPDGTLAPSITVEGALTDPDVAAWGWIYDWDEGNASDRIGSFYKLFLSYDTIGHYTTTLSLESGTRVVIEWSVRNNPWEPGRRARRGGDLLQRIPLTGFLSHRCGMY